MGVYVRRVFSHAAVFTHSNNKLLSTHIIEFIWWQIYTGGQWRNYVVVELCANVIVSAARAGQFWSAPVNFGPRRSKKFGGGVVFGAKKFVLKDSRKNFGLSSKYSDDPF